MFETVNTEIEQRLLANWTDTLIDWDNVEFEPVRGVPFVRLQIEWTNATLVSIGGRARGEGYTNLSIFVPVNSGTVEVSKLADKLALIFDRWDTGSLRFKIARTIRIGQQEEWYRIDIITPFTFDKCL